jgi:cation transport protein ChaC
MVPPVDAALLARPGPFWVFAYGSLMWRPGFRYLQAQPALLHGYHRSFCVYSWVHRGSQHRPGLVLGLDHGGSCRGRAYEIADAERPAVLEYLYQREMPTAVYLPRLRSIKLDNHRLIALTFVVDRESPQYAGGLRLEEMAPLIRHGVGRSGANPDYLRDAVAHMDEMEIAAGGLKKLLKLVER